MKGGGKMNQENKEPIRPVNPRRRKRSKMRVFKEAYLPVIIAALALVLVIVFIVGSVVQRNHAKKANEAASKYQAEQMQEQMKQANELIVQADALAKRYDFDGALKVIDSFSGDITQFKTLNDRKTYYQDMVSNLVAWEDPSQITNLSFQLLIADPSRAFSNQTYGNSFKQNFVTTTEFSAILQQLYDNGYVLVGLHDFISEETGADGSVTYKSVPLYLPKDKKPLMLTQTNVNYSLYMVDSDGDMLPDKNGSGFASRLVLDENGKVVCEMVDKEGQTVTGAYDFVPILDDFVEKHPDFSYKGSKAVLALTGYNGLFGYRTHPDGLKKFGQEAYDQDVETVKQIADALQKSGYTLACYSYANKNYGDLGITEINSDLNAWKAEVVPILGEIDVFAYAQMSDITDQDTYSGEKYEALKNAGFRYFLGINKEGKQQTLVTDAYVRQSRLMVTGENLAKHGDWFSAMFDAASVKDLARNS